MSDVSKPSFDQCWATWVSELTTLSALAATPEERARVARVKQAADGVDVLAVLCHDVKDPLAAVLMGVTLLQKSARGGETIATTIASAAQRLDRVVTAANDLARLRRGDFQVRLQPLPIASLLTTVVENQRRVAGATPIALEVATEAVSVVGDASATTRILMEILLNATGFSTDGASIDVKLSVEGDHAIVRVSDSGPGIDAEHLPHVFDEVANRGHRPRRGAGRGLPIARALAELQNATLTISRREPTGCDAMLRMELAHHAAPMTT